MIRHTENRSGTRPPRSSPRSFDPERRGRTREIDHGESVGFRRPLAFPASGPLAGDVISRLNPTLPESVVLPTDPIVYVALGAGLLVVSYLLYRLVRWLRKSKGESFRDVISSYETLSVLMHPNPDPDAMASAMAVEAIAEQTGTEVEIHYPGQIRHPENRAFRTVLEFGCEKIESASELADYEGVVLVDHNTPRGFVDSERVEPVAVVDHHPGNGTGDDFTDVREDYGATASILTEYLTELDAKFDRPENDADEEFVVTCELATGLTYGIQSDTKSLTNGCTELDFAACAKLFPAADEDLLHRIATPKVSHDVLRVKAAAITDVEVQGSFGVCNVGEVTTVDALPQAVDELMRLEGTTAVVLYGIKDNTVHISARSTDDRVHMGECLQRTVRDIKTASAGGHARMAGGQIPADRISRDDSPGPDFEWFDRRLFEMMNGDY